MMIIMGGCEPSILDLEFYIVDCVNHWHLCLFAICSLYLWCVDPYHIPTSCVSIWYGTTPIWPGMRTYVIRRYMSICCLSGSCLCTYLDVYLSPESCQMSCVFTWNLVNISAWYFLVLDEGYVIEICPLLGCWTYICIMKLTVNYQGSGLMYFFR